jgi:hypothetical protein
VRIASPCSPRRSGATPKKGSMTDKRVLRRSVLRTAFASVAAWFASGAMSRAGAREKMSQKEAQYQDSPKDIRMCATCTLFEPPKSCKVVEGEISPNGWCKAFALAD